MQLLYKYEVCKVGTTIIRHCQDKPQLFVRPVRF